jgi:Tfp pilus assembly protein PilV
MSPSSRARSGLSFVEVVISLAILITAIAALVGNVASLNSSHRVNQEVATVNQLVDALAERIQGARWDSIGTDQAPWAYTRLAPASAGHPSTVWKANPSDPDTIDAPLDVTPADPADANPSWVRHAMTETAVDPLDRLLSDEVGLLQEPSGIEGLRVWVEWYPQSTLLGVRSNQTWNQNIETTDPLVVQSATFDPSRQDSTLVVRIVARWQSYAGGERHYEVSLARRR